VDVQGGLNGGLDLKGRCVNSGTFTIRAGAKAEFSGQPSLSAYLQEAGVTYVYGGAVLSDGGLGVTGIVLAGGKFIAKESGGNPGDPVAMIFALKEVYIDGAEISITPYAGFFGQLAIGGDVRWASGTFKPRVQGWKGQDYVPSDRLEINGTLTFTANTTAQIVPIPLDSDGATIEAAESGTFWLVIQADNILGLGNGPQIVDPDAYTYFTGGNPLTTQLFIKAK